MNIELISELIKALFIRFEFEVCFKIEERIKVEGEQSKKTYFLEMDLRNKYTEFNKHLELKRFFSYTFLDTETMLKNAIAFFKYVKSGKADDGNYTFSK